MSRVARRVIVHAYRNRLGYWVQVDGPDGQRARTFRGQPSLQKWPERVHDLVARGWLDEQRADTFDPAAFPRHYGEACARLWGCEGGVLVCVNGAAEMGEEEAQAGGPAAVAGVAVLPERPKKLCATCGGPLGARTYNVIPPPKDGKHCDWCRWKAKHDPPADAAGDEWPF